MHILQVYFNNTFDDISTTQHLCVQHYFKQDDCYSFLISIRNEMLRVYKATPVHKWKNKICAVINKSD